MARRGYWTLQPREPFMPQDNRILIAIGAGLAVVAAVVIALIFSGGRDPDPAPPPAARGGLTVDVADAPELNTTRELRCYDGGPGRPAGGSGDRTAARDGRTGADGDA